MIFFKQKFVWAKANKSQIDLISEEHDKRIAENYVFDEVLGRHVSRNEYEQRAKFNNDEKQKQTEICATKPAAGEIYRFPSRVKKSEQPSNTPDYIPTLSSGKRNGTKLRPPGFPQNKMVFTALTSFIELEKQMPPDIILVL